MSASDDMPDEERFEPVYDDDPDRTTTLDGEKLHTVKPPEAEKECEETKDVDTESESFEEFLTRTLGEAFGGKAQYLGTVTIPGTKEETLEAAEPLTREQDARVASLYHARSILEAKEASPGFGRGGGVNPPSLGHLIVLSNYILDGNVPTLPES